MRVHLRLLVVLVVALVCTFAHAQRRTPAMSVASPPTGSCTSKEVRVVNGEHAQAGEMYCCISSMWTFCGNTGSHSWDFDCALDWDSDTDITEDSDDLILCLDAAKTYLTVANDSETGTCADGGGYPCDIVGTDNAANIYLPAGVFHLCDSDLDGVNENCPYTLDPGMNLYGVRGRLQDTDSNVSQDLNIIPNGGTVLDGDEIDNFDAVPAPTKETGFTVNGMFTGTDLRGVTIQNIMFQNFDIAMDFGAQDQEGLAMARIQDVVCYGIDNSYIGLGSPAITRTRSCLRVRNFQHLAIDWLKARWCDECFLFMNDYHDGATITSQGGNSIIEDLYAFTYPNPTYGIKLDCYEVGMNFLTFIRPQINAFSGSGSGYAIWIDGSTGTTACSLNAMDWIAVDLEGEVQYGLYANKMVNNYFDISGGANAALTKLFLTTNAQGNVFVSSHAEAEIDSGSTISATNIFLGLWDQAATLTSMLGLFYDGDPAGYFESIVRAQQIEKLTVGYGQGYLKLGAWRMWDEPNIDPNPAPATTPVENIRKPKVKVSSDPSSGDDGDVILTGTSSAHFGVMMWFEDNGDTLHDTGWETCGKQGLKCLGVIEFDFNANAGGDELVGRSCDYVVGTGATAKTWGAFCY